MQKYVQLYKLLFVFTVLFGSCSPVNKKPSPSVKMDGKANQYKIQQVKQETAKPLPEKIVLSHVPFIRQLPELKRGCEVTSLAMLLQSANIQVDKMRLAKEIHKVPFWIGNKHGHPNEGFVGNIYTYSYPGYGAYHKPIYKLAQQYLGERAIDLTGKDIESIYTQIRSGIPVLVITNSTFRRLSDGHFRNWETPQGMVRITYYEHSVLVTGYDKEKVYVHNPLGAEPHIAVSKNEFQAAWEQMGKQAISYKKELK
ncbi:C39 family peptidase [Bacillus sp. Xin]|uniref:C39 family peptidase n=1 Tax=unclassified Bacillus (in: firmicutes) TaxID=185979 RepID=UPI00157339F5|nr:MULTISPECIES: C39 family peptidase [unclassified Bacillus (in: firmicutes)]MBC6973812.1 C39 family peptidase [Bacillus sp. Xin]MCI0766236.1 C39 family peptidase [Bacillus sp. TL12]NSW36035.1 C39 family peptidase [Bacillus sp. Xin1]